MNVDAPFSWGSLNFWWTRIVVAILIAFFALWQNTILHRTTYTFSCQIFANPDPWQRCVEWVWRKTRLSGEFFVQMNPLRWVKGDMNRNYIFRGSGKEWVCCVIKRWLFRPYTLLREAGALGQMWWVIWIIFRFSRHSVAWIRYIVKGAYIILIFTLSHNYVLYGSISLASGQ